MHAANMKDCLKFVYRCSKNLNHKYTQWHGR